ncbi:hypothetical protein [Falsiroseomonas tokyonensis]|uniref:DUF4845 domain-containing protein n=1 Tax=Falsiroseomonas tokyonensis TaxID=430521 RepID=A0ABV7BWX6_9PROT|nr:hypothetical protein [Falsiroseomonas tokyonensis]MBU8539945.1 hypothetical protein [Falsiroseomonas tokyonensis]
MGLLLLVALFLGAQLFSGGWTARPEMEPYVKAGTRAGAERLQRDLLAAHPPGANLGPLMARLQRYGFTCHPVRKDGVAETCRFRLRRSDDQVLTAEVDLGHDGLVVQAIAVRMALAPN